MRVKLNREHYTVAFHKYGIMDKFGVKTNSDLMLFAIKHHLAFQSC